MRKGAPVPPMFGGTETGNKEFPGIYPGFREREISWRDLLLDLKKRGLLQGPKLATADGWPYHGSSPRMWGIRETYFVIRQVGFD